MGTNFSGRTKRVKLILFFCTHHTHTIVGWHVKGLYMMVKRTWYRGWNSALVTVLCSPGMLSRKVTSWKISASSFRTLGWKLAILACLARKENKWILAKLVQSIWPLALYSWQPCYNMSSVCRKGSLTHGECHPDRLWTIANFRIQLIIPKDLFISIQLSFKTNEKNIKHIKQIPVWAVQFKECFLQHPLLSQGVVLKHPHNVRSLMFSSTHASFCFHFHFSTFPFSLCNILGLVLTQPPLELKQKLFLRYLDISRQEIFLGHKSSLTWTDHFEAPCPPHIFASEASSLTCLHC